MTSLDSDLRVAVSAARRSVWLASPYLTGDVCDWLYKRARRSRCTWRMLTELNAASAAYGSLTLGGLRSLLEAGVEVRHLGGLHAKLFLTESSGFTGSANLTSAGLGAAKRSNAELSVVLDSDQQEQARAIYSGWWDSAKIITNEHIDECEHAAAMIPVWLGRRPRDGRRRNAQIDRANRILRRAADSSTWVKAVYRGEDGYPWNSPWVSSSAKGKPSFADGDVLVVYAVYAKTCYTIVEVVGETTFDVERQVAGGVSRPDAERWPWVSDVRVLLEMPPALGVSLERMGLKGTSLRNGHSRMPVGGLAAALSALTK